MATWRASPALARSSSTWRGREGVERGSVEQKWEACPKQHGHDMAEPQRWARRRRAMTVSSASGTALRADCLARRRAAVQAAMQAAKMELLIAYGSGRHTFLAMNPAWYLSGFKQM